MKLPAYPRYRPSGVEWFGDVPEHWTPIALRRTSTRYAGGTPDRSNDSYWDEGTIPWINSGAVNQGLITAPSAFITEEAYRNSSARWVAKDALVMALAGQGKTKGMVAQTGIATTCNQSMAAICPTPPTEPRYLYWLLVSQYEHIRNMAGGEARDGLNLEILGSIPCLNVPPDEQRAIAAFLNRETGRVDRLVAMKRDLIERLNEKRAALIARTVTSGLPPEAAHTAGFLVNPPLKPVTLEWIGNIPEHWEVTKMSWVCVSIRDGTHNPPDRADGVHRLLSVRNVQGGKFALLSDDRTMTAEDFAELQRSYTVDEGDIVLAIVGATTGKSAIVGKLENVTVQRSLAILRPNKAVISSSFLHYVIQSPVVQTEIELTVFKYSAQPGIYLEDIGRLLVVRPPLPEQAAIAAYLDKETAKLDGLVAKAETAVERLQEYRTSLITAAVTGKIDVRKGPAS
jgi:type I restriction enzyme S subunit